MRTTCDGRRRIGGMQTITDGDFELVIAGPTGFSNNIYIIVDRATRESAFVDAPDVEKCLEAAKEAGLRPSKILLTHGHFDHTAGIDGLKAEFGCTLVADASEPGLKDGQLDEHVSHGDTVTVGGLTLNVITNPGHTPASTTFVWGKHAFVGDTLFPGGPGRTRTNENLLEEIESITSRLYTLPGDTKVWPGHGDTTTIDASKAEYAVFAAREHAPDLAGDVLWATS